MNHAIPDVVITMTLAQFTALMRETSKNRNEPPAQCAGSVTGTDANHASFSTVFPLRYGDTLPELVDQYSQSGVTVTNITLTHVG